MKNKLIVLPSAANNELKELLKLEDQKEQNEKTR